MDDILETPPRKKKKVDHEALASAIMKIPRMRVEVARDLLDIGISEIYELQGFSAEGIFDEIRKMKPNTPDVHMSYLRMAIYYSESDDPDHSLLHPNCWED